MSKDFLKKIDFSKVVEKGEDPSFYEDIARSMNLYLDLNRKATFQELVKNVGGSDRRILRLVDQMVQQKIINFDSKYFTFNKSTYNNKIRPSDLKCYKCDSKVVDISSVKHIREIHTFMKKVVKNRPEPTFIFDQRPVTAETTVRRVAYMLWRQDIQNKKIAVIGDDDLTSVALARLKQASEIVVFDIDKRLLEYISKLSNSFKLNIKVVYQDLLKTIPTGYMGYFDTFITDPTPTVKPMTLFTSVGLKMLKSQDKNVGYISLFPSHMEKYVDFQKNLSNMNVIVTDMIPYFNQYDFVKFTYSKSDLKLLNKYSDKSEQKISFWEYFMRFETTTKTIPYDLELTVKDLIGRATKRVLSNPSKDPVLSKNDIPSFIKTSVSEMKKSLKKLRKL